MPNRTLQITDGPSYRGFIMNSNLVSESGWNFSLKMDQDTHGIRGLKSFNLTLRMAGRTVSDDVHTFSFVASCYGGEHRPSPASEPVKVGQWFYVGTYNTQTRKGECIEMTDEEFFRTPMMAYLLKPS